MQTSVNVHFKGDKPAVSWSYSVVDGRSDLCHNVLGPSQLPPYQYQISWLLTETVGCDRGSGVWQRQWGVTETVGCKKLANGSYVAVLRDKSFNMQCQPTLTTRGRQRLQHSSMPLCCKSWQKSLKIVKKVQGNWICHQSKWHIWLPNNG